MAYATAHHEEHHDEHDEGIKVMGFWLFLVTDCILFGALFATYAVLVNHTAGGLTGKEFLKFQDLFLKRLSY